MGRRFNTFLRLLAAAVLLASVALACGKVSSSAAAEAPFFRLTFGSFTKPSGVAVDEGNGNVLISDSGAGVVRIFGPEGGAPAGVASPYEISGFNFCGSAEPSGVAVDNSLTSTSQGAVYVADVCDNAVKKFVLSPTTEEYELSGELIASPAFGEPLGVTVDEAGNVFVGDYGSSSVVEFDPSGTEVARIDTSPFFHPSAVAVDAQGDLFAQGYGTGVVAEWKANSSGVIEPATTGTEIIGGGATGVAYGQGTGGVYIAMGDHVAFYEIAGEAITLEFGTGHLGETERLAFNPGNEFLYVAEKEHARIAAFGPPPPPAEPVIEDESVLAVSNTDALLRAVINPMRSPTRYRFEYGLDENYGHSVPLGEPEIGEGEAGVPVQQPISGLQPGTTYHFRVVATNTVGIKEGDDKTFTTRSETGSGLPDGRAYEMVSPPDKNGLDVLSNRGVEAAVGGNAASFSSLGGFADSASAGLNNWYRAERDADGWTTRGISPPNVPIGGRTASSSVLAFTDDLGRMLIRARPAPPTAPGAQPTAYDFFRRELPDGPFENLTPIVPEPQNFENQASFAGADSALDLVGIESLEQLTPDAPANEEPKAFVSHDGELNYVGVFPDGTLAESSSIGYAICCQENRAAVSADGKQVAFVAQPLGGRQKVFLRENPTQPQSPLGTLGECTVPDDACTIEASASQRTSPDPGGPKDAAYQGASVGGGRVLFRTEEELLDSDTDSSMDMYLYEPTSGTLRRISTDENATDGTGAEVEEVLAFSEDAGTVYFAARGLLIPGQPETPGMHLYVWRDDGTANGSLAYVATLEPSLDQHDWGGVNFKTERVQASPNGRFFVFAAATPISGYDNLNPQACPVRSDRPVGRCYELYRYDAASEALECVSCDPSNEVATGDAALYGFEGSPVPGIGDIQSTIGFASRNVLDDGRVFFESEDSLTPSDSNGKDDVYEWTDSAPHLISGGTSPTGSHFANATPSGSDVFFLTTDRLVGIDTDSNADLYDARVGGGLAGQNPPATPACQGEACRSSAPPLPPQPGIGSSSLSGRGNVKKRHRRHHRKAHHHHRKRHGRHGGHHQPGGHHRDVRRAAR